MKRSTKNLVMTVCICLAVVALFGFLTKGFTSLNIKGNFEKERNEANAIAKTDITLKDGKLSNGVTVKVNSDGSVTLNGKATADATVKYAEISSLAAGTYTFTGAEGGTTGTYYMTATSGSTSIQSDFTGGNKLTLSSAAKTVVEIVIKKDATFFNVTLYPVLYTGDTEVSFYK